MTINASYAVSLKTTKLIGATSADRSEDIVTSLQQSVDNVIDSGTIYKLDIELAPNSLPRFIDLKNLGANYIRSILLKSDKQFGYALYKQDVQVESPHWVVSKTVFLDFSLTPPLGLQPQYISPLIIGIDNPLGSINTSLSLPVTVQLLVIASSSIT